MNFTITREIELPEIQSTLIELSHPSGAQVIYLKSDDDENFFSISFRTWPKTSNGVAHILEHTVLCGSEKFPVKDPFFSMSRRSMNTFMNAFTGGDFTCYPASSQTPADFTNLLHVYLDAVFRPKLTKMSFLQEGHRLEFEQPDNPESPLMVKGIVYNEMKGALSSSEARLNEMMMAKLLPDLTYGINSGGDPQEIPHLTHDELKEFHRTYYHPSRALFFFYGNLPLEGHLDLLEKEILGKVKPVAPLPPLPRQKRFTEKKRHTFAYPAVETEEEEKVMAGWGWLTCHILDQEEILALNVIDLVLMGTDAAPLKQALLKSGLCAQADSSVEDEISEVPFILVCKGCQEEKVDQLEKVIFDALERCVKEGLSKELVEGAIHQLEFSRTEISHPFGLALFFRSALLKQHGGHPEDGLKMHTLFSALREKCRNPDYLPSLITKYLIQNPHCVRVVATPDPDLIQQEEQVEKKKLAKQKSLLSLSASQHIVKQAQELKAYQERQEEIDILPKVTLSDVAKTNKEFSLVHEKVGNLTAYCHPCFTNGILYTDCSFDVPPIEEKELAYLRLMTLFLPQMGCGGRSYQQNLDTLFQYTGGIGIEFDLYPQAAHPELIKPALTVKGKALERNGEPFFKLMHEMITSVNFNDPARLYELLAQHDEEMEQSLQNNPLRYAFHLASSGLSIPLKIRDDLYGLPYYLKLKEILKAFEQDPFTLIAPLESLQKRLLNPSKADVVVACDQTYYDTLKKNGFYHLSQLSDKAVPPWSCDYPLSAPQTQGRLTSTSVAFTTLLFKAPPYTHVDSPALSIAAKLMENRVLHKRIREQGGAYGSGAANVPMSGYFYFYTYRDPHLFQSKKAFYEAVDMLLKGDFDARELEEAKLGIFQDLDAPLSPGGRAGVAYERLRCGRPPEVRQRHREGLFTATKEIIQKAAKTHLQPHLEQGAFVSFANKELFEREKKLFPNEVFPVYAV